MSDFKTEQEAFWAGDFGCEYVERNSDESTILCSRVMFEKIFLKCGIIDSILEIGANRGINIHAIKALKPETELSAIEINPEAVKELKSIEGLNIYPGSALEVELSEKRDLVFTRGVLIHINPDELDSLYQKMYDFSNKYICVAEYYNPTPVSITYRGEKERLFKRDFAGDFLDKFTDLKLVDYGFVYHRDTKYPQDDVTWFLLEKTVNE